MHQYGENMESIKWDLLHLMSQTQNQVGGNQSPVQTRYTRTYWSATKSILVRNSQDLWGAGPGFPCVDAANPESDAFIDQMFDGVFEPWASTSREFLNKLKCTVTTELKQHYTSKTLFNCLKRYLKTLHHQYQAFTMDIIIDVTYRQ